MKRNKLILKEGYKSIGTVFVVAVLLMLFISDCLAYITFILGMFMLYVYRDTYRHIFKNTQSVLAPIDSTVTAIDNVNGKYKIYCKVNLCNNHILRTPVDAEIKVKKYKKGLNLNPNSYKASLYNEQIVLKFPDLKMKLISGVYNHKMKYIKESKVEQGEQIGVFLDGLVVLTIPKENELKVKVGDKLKSGQTILFTK